MYLFAQDETVKRRGELFASSISSLDLNSFSLVINSTLSGSVGINDCLLQVSAEGLPFGGVGPSGYGAHKGKFGFDTFTHLRPVIDSPWYVDLFMSLRFPPYSVRSSYSSPVGSANFNCRRKVYKRSMLPCCPLCPIGKELGRTWR